MDLGRIVYSRPQIRLVSMMGTKLVAATELIREFTSHLDNPTRNAKVQPNERAAFLRALIPEVA